MGHNNDSGKLVDRYLTPPFSVLNTRSGEWKNRYKKWRALGFRDDLGRASPIFDNAYGLHGGLTWNRIQMADPHFYMKKETASEALGKPITDKEFLDHHYVPPESQVHSGTSSFDPVLAELMVLWFSAEGSLVLDPFSGGPTRGIVSGVLGRQYQGVDLIEEQVKFNYGELGKLKIDKSLVSWSHGDSFRVGVDFEVPLSDLIFTCPPYFMLERYSDDPRDLSSIQGFESYLYSMQRVFQKYLERLNNHRFCVIVLTDVRSKKTGGYLRLPHRVLDRLLVDSNLSLYNEFILVNNSASLPLRTGRIFNATRKYGRTHQVVLVLVKGSFKEATTHVRGGELTRW